MPDVDVGGIPPEPIAAGVLWLRPPDPCVGMRYLFFAEDRSSVAAAKSVCAGCPRAAGCLDEALDEPRFYVNGTGVWGGTTPRERRDLRRRARGAA